MRRVLALDGVAHAVALHGLRKDDRGLPRVIHRRMVGREDLVGVVAAPVQAHDVVIGKMVDHGLQLRVLTEEVLPGVGATLGLVVLILAVNHFVHALLEQALIVGFEDRIPVPAPDDLDDIPAGAPEHPFQLLDDLAVAPHRAIEALQIAVHHEDEIVEGLPARERDTAQGLGLVALPVAEEGPDFPVPHGQLAPAVEVLHHVRLINRLERPQAHGNGGELPVVAHEPGVGIGGQTFAVRFPTEAVEILFLEPPFEEGAGINARGNVALDIDEVPRILVRGRPPKIVEAHIVKGGRGGKARDMPPHPGIVSVGTHHHGERVPANEGAKLAIHEEIPGHASFPAHGDGVSVGGGNGVGQGLAGLRHAGRKARQKVTRPIRALMVKHPFQRFQPLPRFLRILIQTADWLRHAALRPLCAPLPFSVAGHCPRPLRLLITLGVPQHRATPRPEPPRHRHGGGDGAPSARKP